MNKKNRREEIRKLKEDLMAFGEKLQTTSEDINKVAKEIEEFRDRLEIQGKRIEEADKLFLRIKEWLSDHEE